MTKLKARRRRRVDPLVVPGVHEGLLDHRVNGGRVPVASAERLGDDLIHDALLDQLRARDFQHCGSL